MSTLIQKLAVFLQSADPSIPLFVCAGIVFIALDRPGQEEAMATNICAHRKGRLLCGIALCVAKN